MSLETIIKPAAAPISLDEAKVHLRIGAGDTAHDSKILKLIQDATGHVEIITRTSLMTRKLAWRLDAFPAGDFVPPLPPMRKVISISYVDVDGATQTWPASQYDVDVYSNPGRIRPAWGESYPGTRAQMNAVTVTYFCGMATLFTAAISSDELAATGHPFSDGDQPDGLYFSGPEGAALPAPLTENLAYFVVNSTAETVLKLSMTSGGSAIDITGTGTGTGAQFYIGLVAADIRAAILLIVGHLFEHHEDVTVGVSPASPMIRGADALLASHRMLKI